MKYSEFIMSKNNEIYIGRKAGKELLEDIHNAKKSVKIISPYLGPEYVKDLIGVKEKGVEVSLITWFLSEIPAQKGRIKPKYHLEDL